MIGQMKSFSVNTLTNLDLRGIEVSEKMMELLVEVIKDHSALSELRLELYLKKKEADLFIEERKERYQLSSQYDFFLE